VRDFSKVTSAVLAEAEVKNGMLVRIHLFPLEFGGKDIPQNVTWIPAGMDEVRLKLMGTLQRFASEGLINKLSVEPEYNGDSFVPCRITYNAVHSEKGGGFTPTMELWKCADKPKPGD
jgi:hypothetical protein